MKFDENGKGRREEYNGTGHANKLSKFTQDHCTMLLKKMIQLLCNIGDLMKKSQYEYVSGGYEKMKEDIGEDIEKMNGFIRLIYKLLDGEIDEDELRKKMKDETGLDFSTIFREKCLEDNQKGLKEIDIIVEGDLWVLQGEVLNALKCMKEQESIYVSFNYQYVCFKVLNEKDQVVLGRLLEIVGDSMNNKISSPEFLKNVNEICGFGSLFFLKSIGCNFRYKEINLLGGCERKVMSFGYIQNLRGYEKMLVGHEKGVLFYDPLLDKSEEFAVDNRVKSVFLIGSDKFVALGKNGNFDMTEYMKLAGKWVSSKWKNVGEVEAVTPLSNGSSYRIFYLNGSVNKLRKGVLNRHMNCLEINLFQQALTDIVKVKNSKEDIEKNKVLNSIDLDFLSNRKAKCMDCLEVDRSTDYIVYGFSSGEVLIFSHEFGGWRLERVSRFDGIGDVNCVCLGYAEDYYVLAGGLKGGLAVCRGIIMKNGEVEWIHENMGKHDRPVSKVCFRENEGKIMIASADTGGDIKFWRKDKIKDIWQSELVGNHNRIVELGIKKCADIYSVDVEGRVRTYSKCEVL
ncbi:hypothetical protein KJ855_03115 [Patescibacteria group bacterium]|nr:hypothetical protein [Patescibacteria group bacterium]